MNMVNFEGMIALYIQYLEKNNVYYIEIYKFHSVRHILGFLQIRSLSSI